MGDRRGSMVNRRRRWAMGIGCAMAVALNAQQPALSVSGSVKTPLVLSVADLKAMPRKTMTVTDERGRTATYEGVLIGEVLRRAGVPMGEALKGKALANYVVAKAKDGYQVVYTVAELDPFVTSGDVLLADTIDGKPFPDAQGPLRIIVPKDKIGARWVRQVEGLEVQTLH